METLLTVGMQALLVGSVLGAGALMLREQFVAPCRTAEALPVRAAGRRARRIRAAELASGRRAA